MRHTRLRRVTSCVLVLLFPLAASASPAQGVVQAHGNVTVNGQNVSGTATVFGGDQIHTAADSVATLTSQGVMVQIQPNTTAIFTGKSLDLGCGNALVSTAVGTMVRVGDIVVTPAAQNTTRIEVSQMNGMVKVTARDNWAVVNDGRLRQTLAPGQSATFARPNLTCQVAVHTVSPGSSKAYLAGAAVAAGLGIALFCTTDVLCGEASPAGP